MRQIIATVNYIAARPPGCICVCVCECVCVSVCVCVCLCLCVRVVCVHLGYKKSINM